MCDRLICICDTTIYMCDVTLSCVCGTPRHDSFMCVIHHPWVVSHRYETYGWVMSHHWNDMTHAYEGNMTWLIHMCDVTFSCECGTPRYDSSRNVWQIDVYLRHDSFMYRWIVMSRMTCLCNSLICSWKRGTVYMSHVTCLNESCPTYESVMSHSQHRCHGLVIWKTRPTRCITLQHTATHYNTLQHTATHCNTLQR